MSTVMSNVTYPFVFKRTKERSWREGRRCRIVDRSAASSLIVEVKDHRGRVETYGCYLDPVLTERRLE